jgi:hypothetical protein
MTRCIKGRRAWSGGDGEIVQIVALTGDLGNVLCGSSLHQQDKASSIQPIQGVERAMVFSLDA